MRVLLIEDDSATAQSIELMLKSESFKSSHPILVGKRFEPWKRPTGQLLAKHCVVPIRRIGFWHPEP